MLTVDTEALPKRAPGNHVERLIWGKHATGTAGIREMCSIGDEFKAKHIFFVDLCGAHPYRDEMHEVIRWLDNEGQDVQLHTHPEYLPDAFWNQHGMDHRPRYMNQYTDDARAEFVVKHFAGEISKITGKDILAFRAGSFRWNASTLRALKAAAIPLSFNNSTAAYYNKQSIYSEQTNFPYVWSNGLIEVPVTERRILPKVGKEEWWARLQFPESSYFRFRPWWGGLLLNMFSGAPEFAVILMHSWSLLYWDENGYGSYRDDQRLEGYRKLVKKLAADYDIITTSEFLDLHACGRIMTTHEADLCRAEIPKDTGKNSGKRSSHGPVGSMNNLSERAAMQVALVRKWPGFKHAQTVLEVGAGSFETLAQLAKMYPDKQFYGVDFVLRPPALAVAENTLANLHVFKHDVRDLSLFLEYHFDFVFSVALVEHIHELDIHLTEVHRVLRNGGRYCFMASPLWSSSQGHHYDANAPDCPIPHYGHLYLTRTELGDFLIAEKGKTPEEKDNILRRVYDREDLARLSRTQVARIVENSPFRITSWMESKDKYCNEKLTAIVLQNNLYDLKVDDLGVSGIVCSLLKAEHGYKPGPVWLSRLRRIIPATPGHSTPFAKPNDA